MSRLEISYYKNIPKYIEDRGGFIWYRKKYENLIIFLVIAIATWKAPIGIIFYHGIVIIYTLFHYKDFGLCNESKNEVQILK